MAVLIHQAPPDTAKALVKSDNDWPNQHRDLSSSCNKSSAIAEKADHCVCLLLADRRHPHIDMGQKNLGRAAVPLWVGGAGWRITADVWGISVSSTLHFLNVPPSLHTPVSSRQV